MKINPEQLISALNRNKERILFWVLFILFARIMIIYSVERKNFSKEAFAFSKASIPSFAEKDESTFQNHLGQPLIAARPGGREEEGSATKPEQETAALFLAISLKRDPFRPRSSNLLPVRPKEKLKIDLSFTGILEIDKKAVVILEDRISGKVHFKRKGENIGRIKIVDFNADWVLLNNDGEEIKLNRTGGR